MPAEADKADLLARQASGRLLGVARGVSLIGPQHRVDEIVARLLETLDPNRLLPVAVEAALATPDSLRDSVGRAHAARRSGDIVLLLVVPDAGRLSAELLRELEQAAEAAISFGGLKFLMASSAPLRPILRDAGLVHLHDCLDADVTVANSLRDARLPPAGERLSRLERPFGRPTPPFRWVKRVAALVLVLATVLIAGLVLLDKAVPVRNPVDRPPPSVSTATPAPPAASTVPSGSTAQASPPAPAAPLAQPTASPPLPPAQPVPPTPPPNAAPLPPDAVAPADSNLLLVAQPGDTLPVLYARVYAGDMPPPYAEVVALNPVIRPGTRLIFPPPPGGWRSKP